MSIRKWYVGDRFDNFSEHNTLEEANAAMASLSASVEKLNSEFVDDPSNFLYILHLTKEQFENLCRNSILF